MKKFILLIIAMFLCLPSFAQTDDKMSAIEDELVKTDSFQSVIENKMVLKEKTHIKDELLEPAWRGKYLFRLGAYKNAKKDFPITDELIDETFVGKAKTIPIKKQIAQDDFFIEKIVDTTKVRKIKPKTKYDFSKQQVPIQIKIAKHLKNTKGIVEGSSIPFLAQHDFTINGKKYKRGTTILGRVETISDSDKMGTPECIKIDNFYIPDKDNEIDLSGAISKTGANRSIWVYPLYQAGNVCFYVAGFIFVPIHGGRAKLLTTESFTVFYEVQ